MSMEPWAATKKVYYSVAVTPASLQIRGEQPLVPSFMSVVG
jgi:hypothetical protein